MGLSKSGMPIPSMGWCSTSDYNESREVQFTSPSLSSYDALDYVGLINDILEWSENVPEFDDKFVRSVQEWMHDGHEITLRQKTALENIAVEWNIPSKYNKKYSNVIDKYKVKIDKIVAWAEGKPNFDKTFLLSIQQNIKKYNKISQKQKDAVDRIVNKWKIVE